MTPCPRFTAQFDRRHRPLAWASVLVGLLCAPPAAAQTDAVRGSMLYLRTDADGRSCLSCHGPDPGQNPNNILSAADRPEAVTKALNTVSAMGFLRSSLSDPDRADLVAYLGTVARANAAAPRLQVWPATLEFGSVTPLSLSSVQALRIRNPSDLAPVALATPRLHGAGLELSHNCPAQLAPLGSCDVRLQLRPPAPGLQRASIELGSAALATPILIGALGQGQAGATSALVWQGAPAQLNFDAGAGITTQTLNLLNPGPMPALLANSSIVGPDAARFRIARGCAPGSLLPAGVGCAMTISYSPSLKPQVEASLQLRSDQGNPGSVLLLAKAAPVEPAPMAVPDSGGGCTMGPPGGQRPFDPLLALLAMAAAWAVALRGGRRG